MQSINANKLSRSVKSYQKRYLVTLRLKNCRADKIHNLPFIIQKV